MLPLRLLVYLLRSKQNPCILKQGIITLFPCEQWIQVGSGQISQERNSGARRVGISISLFCRDTFHSIVKLRLIQQTAVAPSTIAMDNTDYTQALSHNKNNWNFTLGNNQFTLTKMPRKNSSLLKQTSFPL